MTEHKTKPVGLFIGIAIGTVFLALGIAVWFKGPQYGWSRDTRIIIELCLFSALLLSVIFVKYFEAVLLWIASLRAAQWLACYDEQKRAQTGVERGTASDVTTPDWAASLRSVLRDRHGWRWRYWERWVVVAGDELLVKRLAPGLANTGYAITGETVLLYARDTRDKVDTGWLDQIRRLRRRRPVDAIVAVTRNYSSANAPFDAEGLSQRLARHARALRWAAPAYLLNVTDFGGEASGPDEAIGLTWSNSRIRPDEIERSLRGLAGNLADAGVVRLKQDPNDRYPAELSRHIDGLRGALSGLVVQTGQSRFWRNAVHGMLFAPLFRERELVAPVPDPEDEDGEPISSPQQRTIWETVADHSRGVHGRRVGFSLSTAAAWAIAAFVGLWVAGTIMSGMTNRTTIRTAADTATKLSTVPDRTQAALTLDALQKQLDTLEVRQHDGAPWYTRFGLNRDAQLFAALWPGYESGASRIIVAPMRVELEERLRQLASLSDAEIASGGDAQIKSAYATLKTYLMLAKPEHADAKFLAPQLIDTGAPARPVNSTMSEGAWQDLRQHLIASYADRLGQHLSADGSSLAIIVDADLVNATRQTVIGVRGIQNSTDAIYQQILDDAKPKYPPVSLATLLGDTSSRGLFNTTATVPGVFTRAAWDERISKAIDEVSEQRSVTGDWVLSDNQTSATAPSSLKTELRQRYFDDYARAWEQFLNSLRWQRDATLTGTVDQLTLLADPQRSPLAALMNVVVYQAGTGTPTQSLSDSLINKAQQLVGADESPEGTSFGAKDPSKIAPSRNAAPLVAAFGSLLRLAGSDLAGPGNNAANGKGVAQMAATGELSVPRYMERVTAMRLKLQQIVMGSDPDAMSRAAAQSVLQGKTSDIADSRDYASRLAASLGEQWAGFGDLLQAPLDQTWQVVLQPAASSLNDTWRTAIVGDWDKTFGGRYPFADSDNDASLPEMARFMRSDNGVIAQFITTQLAGIIERQGDRWVLVQSANRGSLTLDPAFLPAMNKLTRVSNVLFPSGDAHVRYELRTVPTPGIAGMKFVLSGRQLHYFNQKEEWTPFVWPGDTLENITHVEWQTEQGGLRSAFDAQGRFGLIRLLERAAITPLDSARYLLSWRPDQGLGIALTMQLRSEAGAGPLDVLTLRRYSLPPRIFVTGSPKGVQKQAVSGPPPLPGAMLESAKHAEESLRPGLPGVSSSVAAVGDTSTIQTVDAGAAGMARSAKQTPPAPVEAREARATLATNGSSLSTGSPPAIPPTGTKPRSLDRLGDGLDSARRLAGEAFVY